MISKHYKVVAIVLAAGQSKRMGAVNKLLARLDSQTLLQHVLGNLKQSEVDETVVVVGYESEKIIKHIVDPSISCVINDDYQSGLSSSVKIGIEAIGSRADAVLIVQADMPFITPSVINKIVRAFNNNSEIIIPRYNSQIGNPLLWSSTYFDQLKLLSGDKGARQILNDYQDKITYVDVANIGVLVDIDDPDSLAYFQNRFDKE